MAPQWNSALIRRQRETRVHSFSPPCRDTKRRLLFTNQEGGIKLASTLILYFPVPRTVRNKCLLFKLPHLWYFVIVAKAHKYNNPFIKFWDILKPRIL